MKILLVAATELELAPLRKKMQNTPHLPVETLTTGVGAVHTAFALAQILAQKQFSYVINLGIAGSFCRKIRIGEVVEVVQDEFADYGIETPTGFKTLFECGLAQAGSPPFSGEKLTNPDPLGSEKITQVSGITAGTGHGNPESIARLQKKFMPGIETMESAAFFYTCLMKKQKFAALRAISNYVEPRDKSRWNIPLALENLSTFLWKWLKNETLRF